MEKQLVKLSKTYPDGSGESISLQIDTAENKSFQVSINDSNVLCTMEDLEWLRNAIDEAFAFVNKTKK